MRLDLAGLNKYGHLDVLVLVGLPDVLDKRLLVLHEVGFVVALGNAQLAALPDVLVLVDLHDAVALHGGVVVLGAADVGLVGHGRDLLLLDVVHTFQRCELLLIDLLGVRHELLLVVLLLQIADLVALDLEAVQHLLEGALLLLRQHQVHLLLRTK